MLDDEGITRLVTDMWTLHQTELVWLDRVYGYTTGQLGVPAVPEGSEQEVKDLAKLSGRRLRHANERLASQSFQTVQSRVAVVLSNLVDQARSEDGGQERDVLIRITQADIAQLAGSSRESASRFLATLERAGVLQQGRGRIVVHDPAALAGYVY